MLTIYLKPKLAFIPGLKVPPSADDIGTLALAGLEWVSMYAVEVIRDSAAPEQAEVNTLEDALKIYPDEMKQLCQRRAPLLSQAFNRPLIMGILNVTPDSFSDGGQFDVAASAVSRGLELVEEGADIIDIGGESTRPGAAPVALHDELSRVIPVIEGLRGKTKALISIDTRKAKVMEAALRAGADIINDVSALTYDDEALRVAANGNVPVVLMHAQGTPENMQDDPKYSRAEIDVFDYLAARVEAAISAGIKRENIIIDPGIGFGKTAAHNCALLDNLGLFHGIGVPLLLGVSRKSFIAQLSEGEPPLERLPGSLAGLFKGVLQGVQIIRVHDVKESSQAIKVWFGNP